MNKGVEAICLAILLTVLGDNSVAQSTPNYPTRAVKMIVPTTPGGNPDLVGRLIAARLSDDLGQAFLVENRPGAGEALAADLVAKAAADGYTLCVCSTGAWGVLPAIRKDLPFNPAKDFQPISFLSRAELFLVVRADLKAGTLSELIALARANPGKLNYGTPGIGTLHHLITATFLARSGTEMVHVPYNGSKGIVPAMVAGDLAIAMQTLTSVGDNAKEGGKVRILAVARSERSTFAPDVPTLAELGVDGMDFPGDLALLAPAETPAFVVKRLSSAVQVALRDPKVLSLMRSSVSVPVLASPEALAAQMRRDFDNYTRAAKLAGVNP